MCRSLHELPVVDSCWGGKLISSSSHSVVKQANLIAIYFHCLSPYILAAILNAVLIISLASGEWFLHSEKFRAASYDATRVALFLFFYFGKKRLLPARWTLFLP